MKDVEVIMQGEAILGPWWMRLEEAGFHEKLLK